MTMQIAQRKTQSANRVERLRFAAQVAEQTEKLGARIAQERKARKWSRPELARRLPGVTTGNDVYRWEKGKHMPRSDTLDALADLFGIEVADLYAGPATEAGSADLMDSLSAAESPSLKSVEDQIASLRAELLAELAEVRTDLKGLRSQKQPAARKAAGKRS